MIARTIARVHAVGDAVRERHVHVDQAGSLEPRAILALRESPGDAADVAAPLAALVDGEAILGDDVGDADPAAGLEHARDLGQDGRLVGREVHDAVRDHDVDRFGRQRDVLDQALEEVDVRRARLPRVSLREREHLVGHVQAVDGSRGPDPLRGEEDVDASTGAEVEDGLALVELGDGQRIAAPRLARDGVGRKARSFVLLVEALAEERRRLVAAAADPFAVASAAVAVREPERRLRVALAHLFPQVRGHTATPFRSRTPAARSRPSRSSS